MDKKQLGALGEQYTARFLEKEGWQIVCLNFRCRYGEVDVIASKGEVLAFVEVKTRSKNYRYRPYVAVTPAKQGKLLNTAEYYMIEHPGPLSARFDVMELVVEGGEVFRVLESNYIPCAFTAQGMR